VRNLNQNASPVPRLRIAACGAAVGKVDENLKTLADDVMAFFSTYAGHQTHATSIVFVPGMIESLRLRSAETKIL
jgi:hypothetical protein